MITRALILDIYIRTAAVCLVINIHIMMMNLQCLSVQTVIICEDKHKQLFNFDERFHEKKCWQWGAAVRGGPLNTKPNIYSFYPLIAIDGSKDLSLYFNSSIPLLLNRYKTTFLYRAEHSVQTWDESEGWRCELLIKTDLNRLCLKTSFFTQTKSDN